MTRLFKYILIICFCLVISSANAGRMDYLKGVASTVTCSTANDVELWAPTDQSGGDTGSADLICQKFTIAAQKTITGYNIKVCDNNSDTGDFDFEIYNHDAGNDYPDETSLVANSTKNTNASALGDCGSPAEYFVELASTFDLPSGTYWMCRDENNGADVVIEKDNTSAGDRFCYSTDGGSNWTCVDDVSQNFELWGCN